MSAPGADGAPSTFQDAVLTFLDEEGNEWLAGALISPLQRKDGDESIPLERIKDRAFRLRNFTIVRRRSE